MNVSIGEALREFNAALQRFNASMGDAPGLEEALFDNGRTWMDLLTYKLLPQLGGDACLVVAVAGGTNTGKSAVFNSLVGDTLSPALPTAAATRHPVLAANARRCREALEGGLVSGFEPTALENAGSILQEGSDPRALYVVEADSLPDHLVYLDTPDVDSIERSHWSLAEHIRAAGDVVLAVVTGEKYKDERVVGFFEQAVQAGRMVIPVMNKANPADDFAVARRQLLSFCEDIGAEKPCAVAPLDADAIDAGRLPLKILGAGELLRAHLESLDAAEVKRQVYQSTIERFLEESGEFIAQAERLASSLRSARSEAEEDIREVAGAYRPEFPQERCGLVHEYLQQRRRPIQRGFGQLGEGLARMLSAARGLSRSVFLSGGGAPRSSSVEAIRDANARQVRALAFSLVQRWQERCSSLPPAVSRNLGDGLTRLELDDAVRRVVDGVCGEPAQQQSFKGHAREYLTRWHDANGPLRWTWRGVDGAAALLPVLAVAAAGGLGGFLSTMLFIVGWPVGQQTVFRAIEYRFADRLLDLQSPWQEEQQRSLADALAEHIANPIWRKLADMNALLESEDVEAMRTWRETCRNI